jgi:ribosomal protein S18 acetylase RimI-like enzyme
MTLPIHIREFHYPEDYEGAVHLWEGAGSGVKVGRSDSPEEIQKKLQRDPDLFLVAESDHEIIGTVIGGYDGRRGMVYHLAVRDDFRRRGVATQLMSEVEKRLQAKGCVKCYLLVFADNADAIQLYEQLGWRNMREDFIFGKEF